MWLCNLHVHTQISDATTDADMVAAITNDNAANMVFEAGFTKPLATTKISDKTNIISLLTTYHLFIKPKAAMDQYKEGLILFGLCRFIEDYPDLMRPLFVDERVCITASKCYGVILPHLIYTHLSYRPVEEYVFCTLFHGWL